MIDQHPAELDVPIDAQEDQSILGRHRSDSEHRLGQRPGAQALTVDARQPVCHVPNPEHLTCLLSSLVN